MEGRVFIRACIVLFPDFSFPKQFCVMGKFEVFPFCLKKMVNTADFLAKQSFTAVRNADAKDSR